MNKISKYIFSIGVPVFFIMLLPALDFLTLNHSGISDSISKGTSYALGLSNGFNPYYAVVSFMLLAAVWGGLSYLLIKKAIIKGS